MNAHALIGALTPVCVFVMMACIGLELLPTQFGALLRAPKPLLVGIAGQLLAVPAAGFLIAAMYAAQPAVALAAVLIVAAPGGPVANGFVLFGRGRPDVSVALTAINAVLSLASTPLIVHLGFAWFGNTDVSIDLPIVRTIERILLVVVLPIFIGMALRRFAGVRAPGLQRWTRRLATTMLLCVLAIVFAASVDALARQWTRMLPAALILCVTMLGTTTALAYVAGLDRRLRMTVATEVGVHNVPLAILMAQSLLGRPELSTFIVIYAPVIAFLALGWAGWHRLDRGAGAASHCRVA